MWRAVDQHGNVLDILIQKKRDGRAATRFFRTLMKEAVPSTAGVGHRQTPQLPGRAPDNDVDNGASAEQIFEQSVRELPSTDPATRTGMKGFRTVGSAQRFLAAFSRISPHFRPPRHRMTATDHHTELSARFQVWDQIIEHDLAA